MVIADILGNSSIGNIPVIFCNSGNTGLIPTEAVLLSILTSGGTKNREIQIHKCSFEIKHPWLSLMVTILAGRTGLFFVDFVGFRRDVERTLAGEKLSDSMALRVWMGQAFMLFGLS